MALLGCFTCKILSTTYKTLDKIDKVCHNGSMGLHSDPIVLDFCCKIKTYIRREKNGNFDNKRKFFEEGDEIF